MTLQEQVKEITAKHKAMSNEREDWDRIIVGELLQSCDKDADFVSGSNYYLWYFLIGAYLRPDRIVELGVRYGYSLKALSEWQLHWSPDKLNLWGFDNECDGVKTLHVAEKYFREKGVTNLHIVRDDTQKLTTLGIPYKVDLVNVDALHTDRGVYHDLVLATEAVKPGGIILVDDTIPGCVSAGTEWFCHEHKLEFVYIPTLRGMHVIQVPPDFQCKPTPNSL